MRWFLDRIVNFYPLDIFLVNLAYTKVMRRDLGIAFNNLTFYYQDGREYSFRGERDLAKLKIYLQKSVNQSFAEKWGQEIKRRGRTHLSTVRKVFRNNKSFKRYFPEFTESYTALIGIFQLPHLCQMLLPKANQKLLYKFGLARDYAARLLIKAEKIYRRKIGHYLDFKNERALMLAPFEVMSAIRSHRLPKDIKQRKTMLLFTVNGVTRVYWNKKADMIFGKINQLPKLSGGKVAGQCAYPGKVRGRVYVALNVKDFKKTPKGSILVCSTTRYDIVQYLKGVKAIIADQGGITSHASIISREKKIPCVVGTHSGTRVLKTGERVEVDANKGLVRKIR